VYCGLVGGVSFGRRDKHIELNVGGGDGRTLHICSCALSAGRRRCVVPYMKL